MITEYSTGLDAGSRPGDIIVGPDGNLWFTDQGTTPALGQITITGLITQVTTGAVVPLARQADANPRLLPSTSGLTSGPNGNVWFTEPYAAQPAIGTVVLPSGYHLAAADGGIFNFGSARFAGSMGGRSLNKPVVGVAEDPATGGYWLVAADGGIFNFNAPFEGSKGGSALSAPVVGIASTANGLGYWEVGSDGAVYPFGDAVLHGSMVGNPLNKPIVGIAADWSTGGYWEVASDGEVFSFDAPFEGSMGATPLNKPVVGIATAPHASGYWLVAADGGVFALGSAGFSGSMGGQSLNAPVVGIGSVPSTSLRSSSPPVILVG
ncbi:MAG: hypothetical protein ACLPR9_12340 [Acidimicrobiales bacterium]